MKCKTTIKHITEYWPADFFMTESKHVWGIGRHHQGVFTTCSLSGRTVTAYWHVDFLRLELLSNMFNLGQIEPCTLRLKQLSVSFHHRYNIQQNLKRFNLAL